MENASGNGVYFARGSPRIYRPAERWPRRHPPRARTTAASHACRFNARYRSSFSSDLVPRRTPGRRTERLSPRAQPCFTFARANRRVTVITALCPVRLSTREVNDVFRRRFAVRDSSVCRVRVRSRGINVFIDVQPDTIIDLHLPTSSLCFLLEQNSSGYITRYDIFVCVSVSRMKQPAVDSDLECIGLCFTLEYRHLEFGHWCTLDSERIDRFIGFHNDVLFMIDFLR